MRPLSKLRFLVCSLALWCTSLSASFAQDLVEPWITPDSVLAPDAAFMDAPAVWTPYVSGTVKPGDDRSLLGGELVVPVWQDGRRLVFVNARGQIDDNDASEWNLGLAYREMLWPGWIVGAYAYWDHLHTAHSNNFNQATLGVEAMSFLWDMRMNVYLPESGAEFTSSSSAMVSNGTVVVVNGQERAYHGVDVEVGALLYSWGSNADHELRGFFDLFYFDSDAPGFEDISGPRRLEWRWYDLPCLGNGTRFTCGIEAQYDDVREGQFFGFATLRIPLDPCAWRRPKLNPLQRRMVDPIVRDVDVVTNVASQSERAIDQRTGRIIDQVTVIDGRTARETGKSVDALIAEAGSNSLVVLSGDAGDLRVAAPLTLQSGQTVLGGGSPLRVTGLGTGRSATLWAPGRRPDVIHNVTELPGMGNPPPRAGFVLTDGNVLQGLGIVNGAPGILVESGEGILVRDVDIRDSQGPSHIFNVPVDVEDVTVDGVPL